MKNLKYVLIIFSVIVFIGCERFALPDNEQSFSEFNTDESHEYGTNCMDCHYTAGRGEGWFTVAGSVGGNTKEAVIELTDEITGEVKKIEVDQKQNFYTTEAIDFKNGMKVGIRNSAGEMQYMNGLVMIGQCSLCHGSTEESLSVN